MTNKITFRDIKKAVEYRGKEDVIFDGSVRFIEHQDITDLGQVVEITGYAYFVGSNITNLGLLESVGDYVDFDGTKITSLGKLRNIGGDAYFESSQITDLGALESIGGNVYYENSKLTKEQIDKLKRYAITKTKNTKHTKR